MCFSFCGSKWDSTYACGFCRRREHVHNGQSSVISTTHSAHFLKLFISYDVQVEDVVTTKITLPVKERIAIGLSKSGTSNTFKVVSYNALLGVIAFFSTGAIYQFCVFAIVVLLVHWIHINTMFIGVLAIDLHRLEVSSPIYSFLFEYSCMTLLLMFKSIHFDIFSYQIIFLRILWWSQQELRTVLPQIHLVLHRPPS